jgi:hypothetical protein
MKPTTYSLKQFVLAAYTTPEGRKLIRRHYLTVAAGLSWQDAKAARRQNRSLQIVPERPA